MYFFERFFEHNSNEKYGLEDIKGISIQKCFIETKADMTDVSLKSYILVEPNAFSFFPAISRNGEKITIALNQSADTCAVSLTYIMLNMSVSKLQIN